MLSSPAPFPHPGSFALLEHDGETHLVRILWRRWDGALGAVSAVAFPLRDGASGNMEVAEARLIDGTPLDATEEREFHDLDRALAGKSGRTKKQKAMLARRAALKARLIWSHTLTEELRKLRLREANQRATKTRRAA